MVVSLPHPSLSLSLPLSLSLALHTEKLKARWKTPANNESDHFPSNFSFELMEQPNKTETKLIFFFLL